MVLEDHLRYIIRVVLGHFISRVRRSSVDGNISEVVHSTDSVVTSLDDVSQVGVVRQVKVLSRVHLSELRHERLE
jgi:hypothetical protein